MPLPPILALSSLAGSLPFLEVEVPPDHVAVFVARPPRRSRTVHLAVPPVHQVHGRHTGLGRSLRGRSRMLGNRDRLLRPTALSPHLCDLLWSSEASTGSPRTRRGRHPAGRGTPSGAGGSRSTRRRSPGCSPTLLQRGRVGRARVRQAATEAGFPRTHPVERRSGCRPSPRRRRQPPTATRDWTTASPPRTAEPQTQLPKRSQLDLRCGRPPLAGYPTDDEPPR